jgi:hypothetical protein
MSSPGSRRSAFQDSFAALWHEPVLIAAELAWRWCFGLAAWVVVIIGAGLFLDSVKISRRDEFLLGTLQPQLLQEAVRHIFRGSLTRFVLEQAALVLGLVLLWCLAAAAGRAATLRRLVAMFSADEEPDTPTWEFIPIFTLQLLRAVWSMAALSVMIFCLVFGTMMAADERALRAGLWLSFGIGLAWAFGVVLNWFFGVAPLFCVRDGAGAMDAVAESVDFVAGNAGRLLGLGVGFLALRLVWAAMMFFAVLAPLRWAGHLAPGWVILMMAVVALIYFAGADLLCLARLAAYASLAEEDSHPAEEVAEIGPPEPALPVEFGTELGLA